MFSVGTRVYVYSSSVSKKLGPKRHSLGYVSSCENSYVIHNVEGFPIKNQDFIITSVKVVFSRYGREEKNRCETRDFLNIVPAFTRGYGNGLDQRVTTVLDIFNNSTELATNDSWRSAASNLVSGKISGFGTLIPLSCGNAEAMAGENLVVWLNSILKNEYFIYLIKSNKNLPTLQAVVSNKVLLGWTANAARSNTARSDLLKWAGTDKHHMNELVELLQIIRAIFDKRVVLTSTHSIIVQAASNNLNLQTFINWYVRGMFTDNLFDRRCDNFPTEYVAREINSIIKTMPTVRNAYLTLKPKYI